MIAEIGVLDDVPLDVVVERIESCIAAVGLNVTLKGTLATYPGSVHWHTKRGKEPGVLEITLWPERRRLWFSVHRNRTAPWIEETKVQLKQAIASSLAAVKTRNDSAAFLEADDFFLRSWEIEDAGWYVQSRDEAVFQWTTEKRDLTVAQTEAAIRQLNSNADAFSFAVVDSKSKTILGNIALVLEENDRSVGEIMYWLAPWGRGRGMATNAVKLLCEWALDSLTLDRITLKTHPENVRSQRVAERAGFCRQARTNEGRLDAENWWFELSKDN